jgi:hypothetical protein
MDIDFDHLLARKFAPTGSRQASTRLFCAWLLYC